jgi:hypothetical protein
MSGGLGVSIDDAIALSTRMAQSPADSVSLAPQLVQVLQSLPPPAGQLLSRPAFERATLFTLGCSFENVPISAGSIGPQVIRCQHDVWIRGVQVQAYPSFFPITGQSLANVQQIANLFRQLRFSIGTNGRGLVQVNWRLDARQGFISRGSTGEILAPASLISGDGCFDAPKDWILQKDQTIEVRLQSLLDELGINTADANLILRWVTVCFWAEELDQPSIQVATVG